MGVRTGYATYFNTSVLCQSMGNMLSLGCPLPPLWHGWLLQHSHTISCLWQAQAASSTLQGWWQQTAGQEEPFTPLMEHTASPESPVKHCQTEWDGAECAPTSAGQRSSVSGDVSVLRGSHVWNVPSLFLLWLHPRTKPVSSKMPEVTILTWGGDAVCGLPWYKKQGSQSISAVLLTGTPWWGGMLIFPRSFFCSDQYSITQLIYWQCKSIILHLASLQGILTTHSCSFCSCETIPLPAWSEVARSSTWAACRVSAGSSVELPAAAAWGPAFHTAWARGCKAPRALTVLVLPTNSSVEAVCVIPWPAPASCHNCKVFERER